MFWRCHLLWTTGIKQHLCTFITSFWIVYGKMVSWCPGFLFYIFRLSSISRLCWGRLELRSWEMHPASWELGKVGLTILTQNFLCTSTWPWVKAFPWIPLDFVKFVNGIPIFFFFLHKTDICMNFDNCNNFSSIESQ